MITRRQGWVLAAMATLTMAVSYLNRQVLAVLAPRITSELGLSPTKYGLLASAFSVAYFVGSPLAGRLVDRIGVRRALMLAVIAWSVVAASHSLTQGFVSLYYLRLLLGLAESPSFPGGTQTVHRAIAPEEQPRAMGVLFTGSSLGAMVAPFLAISLAGNRSGWRSAFVGTALVGVAGCLCGFWQRGASKCVPCSIARETKTTTNVSFASLLRMPVVYRAVALVLGIAPIMGFMLLWSAKMLVDVGHVPDSELSQYLFVPPLLFDVGALAFGDWAARRRRSHPLAARSDRPIALAAALMCLCVVLIAFVNDPLHIVIAGGVAMAGGGGLFAIANADMMSKVPASHVARAGGITAAAQSLAYIVANPLIGMSIERTSSYALACVALGACAVPAFTTWYAVRDAQ